MAVRAAEYNPLHLDLNVHHAPKSMGDQVAQVNDENVPLSAISDLSAPDQYDRKYYDPDHIEKWNDHIEKLTVTLSPTHSPTHSPTPETTPEATPFATPKQCFRCQLAAWTSWSPCAVSCGGGESRRWRTIIHPDPTKMTMDEAAAFLLCDECPYMDGDEHTLGSKDCNMQPCPFDCVLEPWSEWKLLHETNGNGNPLLRRTRAIVSQAQHGGTQCPAASSSKRIQERVWKDWCDENPEDEEWGECNGSGYQVRKVVRKKCSKNALDMVDGSKKEVQFQLKLKQTRRCDKGRN